jgi:poly(A)-specific ribonuclease
MEVNATTFRHDLLDILVSIAEADFVSFDLELSGIPSRQQRRSPNAGRHTLEERYLEAREGANKHQILQVGFTCARFDYIENRYILKPYNVNLSPLLEDRLGIDREFSFQTGSISFLLACGFRMDAPFTEGVQYLSREEAELVKQREFDRIDDKNEYQDLQLKRTDIESLGFLDRVRRAIEGWKKSKSPFLEITTRTGLDGPPEVAAITKFEKRLVYQLIRAEYQDLKAIGRTHSMKIFYYDEQREEENRKWQKTRVKEQIMRQTGFRWVIEALTGDGVDLLDPRYFERSRSGEAISDLENIKGKFDRAKIKLQTHQPVLVGHNMFTDIVYLYRCFIGELPPTLGEFCEALHELFPRIVDTKYLATHDEGDLNASPTLERIDTLLSSQELPDISELTASQRNEVILTDMQVYIRITRNTTMQRHIMRQGTTAF